MKKVALFIFFCTFSSFKSHAQISIDAVSTDTIDLFNKKNEISSTTPKYALWSTLLLPGPGHQSIGRTRSALSYLSVDAISLCGAIFFNQYSKKCVKNYHAYAAQYAGVNSPVKDDFFWQVIGNFNTSADFHGTMRLVRDPDNRFIDENFYWSWEDTIYQKEFVSMQKNAKQIGIVSSFFIGAMILNRIISFIDLRSMFKNNHYNDNSTISIQPFIGSSSTSGLIFTADY